MAEVTMRVWRGDDGGGAFSDYVLPAVEGEVVLDVIHRIQAGPAPDLACRWNCKAGKCGSCSADMDSLPADDPVVVAPLRTFPLIRDLVTDVSFNYEMARRVPPLAPRAPEPDGTYRMMQIDIERGQEFRKCIECFMCQNVCHVIRDHEENKARFAGPRLFIRVMELESHPLDTDDRRQMLRQQMGVGMCNITKCCTEVCPEHIRITDNAIIPLKERVIDASYDPFTWLGRRIRRRNGPRAAAPAAANAGPAPGAGTPPAAPSPDGGGVRTPAASGRDDPDGAGSARDIDTSPATRADDPAG